MLERIVNEENASVKSSIIPFIPVGELVYYPSTGEVILEKEIIGSISATKKIIFDLLAENIGKVVIYDTIKKTLWPDSKMYLEGDIDNIRVQMHRLFSEINEIKKYIFNIHGEGYVLMPDLIDAVVVGNYKYSPSTGLYFDKNLEKPDKENIKSISGIAKKIFNTLLENKTVSVSMDQLISQFYPEEPYEDMAHRNLLRVTISSLRQIFEAEDFKIVNLNRKSKGIKLPDYLSKGGYILVFEGN